MSESVEKKEDTSPLWEHVLFYIVFGSLHILCICILITVLLLFLWLRGNVI